MKYIMETSVKLSLGLLYYEFGCSIVCWYNPVLGAARLQDIVPSIRSMLLMSAWHDAGLLLSIQWVSAAASCGRDNRNWEFSRRKLLQSDNSAC